MKIEIDIPEETVDEIVLRELKLDYELCSQPDYIDCSNDRIEPDQELLDALKMVIKYHSSHGGYQEWLKDINEVPCKTHPDAPHGFNRNASHAEGRYVCECEHWETEE